MVVRSSFPLDRLKLSSACSTTPIWLVMSAASLLFHLYCLSSCGLFSSSWNAFSHTDSAFSV